MIRGGGESEEGMVETVIETAEVEKSGGIEEVGPAAGD